MGFTDKFRTQHNEILLVAQQMTAELKGAADAAALRKLLSNLAGKLNFHLAMEDEALYPRLMERKEADSKALANKFMTEMGGLGKVFRTYNEKWQAAAIRTDPAGFAGETHAVFAALSKRIARENNELYPLADRTS
jgi:iron-sulfur cluster repair protein YtfE (RIC family)